MSETEVACRLCMSTETLSNLFKTDGDTTLDQKVQFCIDLKVSLKVFLRAHNFNSVIMN